MLADGGEAIADLAVLRDQAGVFGPVASTPTAWRLPADTDEAALASLRTARASAREVAWMQAAETGEGIPAARAGGRELPGLVLDPDATLITCHSEKEQAAPTYKGGFGFHPLLRFPANTGEAVSGRLRPGNPGANTAADHITVPDQALAQIPDAHRHGTDILIRTDSAGSAKAFLAHVRGLRKRGIRTFYSVGYAITEPVRRAVRTTPDRLWHPALDQDGTLRDGAEVAELTGLVDLDGYPTGTRIIVRPERPHPGAQLSLFDHDEGLRHQVFLTDTPYSGGGSAQFPEGPSPRASRRSGPHPVRQDHRLRPLPLPRLQRQRRPARTQPRGQRSAGLDARPAAGRGTGHCRAEEAPLPAAACRRPPHPRQPTPALAHIGDLALENRTGHGLPSPRRTAPSRRLTGRPLTAHDPKDLEEPDHRAGSPPCPNTENASATPQFTLSDASSPQPKRRG
ncbi:hypothetical protein ACE1SV_73950 [Streptomyces sp. E-15]